MANKLACRHFAQGKCLYGKKCKYSHDPAAPTAPVINKPTGPPSASVRRSATHDAPEELLKKWRFSIPKDARKSRPLGDEKLADFIDRALELVESDSEIMQFAIQELATEQGLTRVRELVSRDLDQVDDQQLAAFWRKLLLPYFRILSHESVMQSMVVQVRLGTLLNDLYGINGDQGSMILRAAVRHLSANPDEAELAICFSVLASMLQGNSAAKVNTSLQATAEALVALLDLTTLTRSTERDLRTIQTLFKLGRSIPELRANVQKEKAGAIRPTFTVSQDLPGHLSEYGPRHDNDSDDIRDIQVLPTRGEIESERVEYLPREEPSQWHRPGLAGLVDRHFRLVREDTVGQLRDAAKFQLQCLQNPEEVLVSHQQGARTNVYHDVFLENVSFENQDGLLFVFRFNQPATLAKKTLRQREDWWTESRKLAGDSLICLLSSQGKAAFLVVHTPGFQPPGKTRSKPLNETYGLHQDPKTAYIVAKLTTTDPEAAADLLSSCAQWTGDRMCLVEFPGVLLPAFAPTLAALKHMAETLDVPFANLLVPGSDNVKQQPPAYSSRPGFQYDLSNLLPKGDRADAAGTGNREADVDATLARSILDEAQQKAAKHALNSALALIQGPPGTGKSFTGVKLIQTLLESKEAAKLGPIICVCYTNHALDQLLEHLVDAGVEQLIRIGSRSKSERLAAVNLRTVSQRYRFTKIEGHEFGKAKAHIEETGRLVNGLLSHLQDVLANPDKAIMSFLSTARPRIHAQLLTSEDEGGWRTVRGNGNNSVLAAWLQGGLQQPSIQDQQFDFDHIDIHEVPHGGRLILYQQWLSTITAEIYEDLQIQLESYNDDKDKIDSVRGDLDLRVLSNASVIGVTTTGLARSLKHLRKLPSKVLVVEEAGEVLEAHLLTAMLPSLEHAILIGDHQQLRPKVQNYELSVDNPASQIALDVSLFERLVQPRVAGSKGLDFVTLETQRRMHPSISRLIRGTLYPKLRDFETVNEYPAVVGMRHRLFWLDHDHKEDSKHDQLHSTSHTNRYEVEMIAALVRHLQRQGVYAANDIAVLTPYLGQLRELRRELQNFVDIILNDRDVDELAKDGEQSDEEEDLSWDRPPPVTIGNLAQAVRLATVDNFQGEEAKVVIVSLVRSNAQRKCGFLRTPNRINVLLSRAQHGMYIIGSSETSGHIPMWQQVLSMLQSEGNLGMSLELSCPRHPDTPLKVTEAADFTRVSPEAGCDLMCGQQLPCGHSCPSKCHADSLHNNVFCVKDCARPRKGCTHPCNLVCGEKCPDRCSELVQCDITLTCGHHLTEIPCWLFQDKSQIRCQEPVDRDVPGCGHAVTLPCSTSIDNEAFQCKAVCSSNLDCGHVCKKKCHTCSKRGANGEVVETDHGACKRACGRGFTTCGHSCTKECHAQEPCPPCSAPCEISCAHSRCAKRCNEPCTPCTEETCSSHCPHSRCQMPCGAPCDWVPCSRRCDKTLDCGHQCPSICGEQCPSWKFCQLCASDKIRDTQVDVILMETYAETDLDKTPCIFLPCGHIFSVETLDGLLEIAVHYAMDDTVEPSVPLSVKGELLPFSSERAKSCPNCRRSLRSVGRYGRIVRRSHLDECTKKFIAWSNQAYILLAERLQSQQAHLLDIPGETVITGNVVLKGTTGLSNAVRGTRGGRYKQILGLRTDIQVFANKVRSF